MIPSSSSSIITRTPICCMASQSLRATWAHEALERIKLTRRTLIIAICPMEMRGLASGELVLPLAQRGCRLSLRCFAKGREPFAPERHQTSERRAWRALNHRATAAERDFILAVFPVDAPQRPQRLAIP